MVLLAIIAGEAALVILTTIAQEVLFHGINYYTSTLWDIILGGLATLLAAVLSGAIATAIPLNLSHVPSLVISMIILLEMSYLILSGSLSNPLLFDILSGLSLIVGIWLGYFAVRRSSFIKRQRSG